jgi:hypothetical protein
MATPAGSLWGVRIPVKVITGSSDRDHTDHGRHARHDGGAASPILSLQLLFPSDVIALGGDLMDPSSEVTGGDNVSGPDSALRRAQGDTPDLLNRPADQNAATLAPVPFFGGAGSFARQRGAAIIAKAGITSETRSRQGWHRHVSLVTLAFVRRAAVKRYANDLPLKKPGQPSSSASGALVSPGNPQGSNPPCPTAERACLRHRLVRMAQSPPSRCTESSHHAHGATVMLSPTGIGS